MSPDSYRSSSASRYWSRFGGRRYSAIAALFILLALGATAASGSAPPINRPGWTLVWHDEFNGRTGTAPAKTRWRYNSGCSGWGNNELECYTRRIKNVRKDGRGHLEIVGRREAYRGHRYTSGRILTKGLFTRTYGRFEARMKIPRGLGTWPAFWMLGTNIGKVDWPRCGEIDVMEEIGREPRTVHGSIHGLGYSGGPISSSYTAPKALASAYHVYAAEWSPDRIAWYLDGVRYAVKTAQDLPEGAQWAFDRPFFLILNLAIGGEWPGSPNARTPFPAKLLVDYVRVYTQ